MSGEPGRSTPFPYGADSQDEADAIARAQAAGLQALRAPMWEDQRSIEHFGNWTPVRCECGHSQFAHSDGPSGCNGDEDRPDGTWGTCACRKRESEVVDACDTPPGSAARDECPICGGEADHEPGDVHCYGEADPNG